MKSGASSNPANWYSGYPGYDTDTVRLFGARNPSRTFSDVLLQRSKAISQLKAWMAKETPGAYRTVMRSAPHLLDPERVGVAGFAGLGQGDDTSYVSLPFPADTTAPSTGGGTDWGSAIMNLAAKALPVYGQYQILQTNISRAKQGLPPISSAALAPTFNVGLSRSTIGAGGIGLAGIGAIVLGGLFLMRATRGGSRRR